MNTTCRVHIHTVVLAATAAILLPVLEFAQLSRSHARADDAPAARRDAAWVDTRVEAWQPTNVERAFDEIGWAKNFNFVNATLVGYLDIDLAKSRVRSFRLVTDGARYGSDGSSGHLFGVAVRSLP